MPQVERLQIHMKLMFCESFFVALYKRYPCESVPVPNVKNLDIRCGFFSDRMKHRTFDCRYMSARLSGKFMVIRPEPKCARRMTPIANRFQCYCHTRFEIVLTVASRCWRTKGSHMQSGSGASRRLNLHLHAQQHMIQLPLTTLSFHDVMTIRSP
jgi:hypothetical protein